MIWEPLGVDCAREYVLGFPVHVGLLLAIREDPSSAWTVRLPSFGPVSNQGRLALEIRRAGTHDLIVAMPPFRRRAPEVETVLWPLSSGAPRRILVDLAPLWDAAYTPPGDYDVVVSFRSFSEEVQSAPFRLSLRPPSPDHVASLRGLSPPPGLDETWGEWSISPPDAPEPPPIGLSSSDPLRAPRVFRYLWTGPDDPASVDARVLDALTGVYAPERDLFAAEIAYLRGDPSAFAAISAAARNNQVGLGPWLDDIPEGRGLLSRFRVRG